MAWTWVSRSLSTMSAQQHQSPWVSLRDGSPTVALVNLLALYGLAGDVAGPRVRPQGDRHEWPPSITCCNAHDGGAREGRRV